MSRLRLDEGELGEVMTDDDLEDDENTDWTTDDPSSNDGDSSFDEDEYSYREEPESEPENLAPFTRLTEKPENST